jgi:hypothetical protein
MNGSAILSDEEKQEMIHDANDVTRRKAFIAARILSQQGGIDDYIAFLSENMGFVQHIPSRRITKNFKL